MRSRLQKKGMTRRQFVAAGSLALGTVLSGCAARLPRSLETGQTPRKSFIDMHVHVAGIGTGETGCFVSERFRNSFFFLIDMWAAGVPHWRIEEAGDQLYVQKLLETVRESRTTARAVILALDGVYDAQGRLDREQTTLYVPNDYVLRLAREHGEFLPGVSIHPARRDAIEELDRVAEAGAVLVKWLPNTQRIDPAERRFLPFYRRLAHHRMPLLCHTGEEYALSAGDQRAGDPKRLLLALEEGVTVIAAHCGSLGEEGGRTYLEDFFGLLDRYSNLFGDISALTQINRRHTLSRLLDEEVMARLLHGSDYPLPFFPLASPLYFMGRISFSLSLRIQRIGNVLDRDVATKRGLGVPESIFTKAEEVLKPRLVAWSSSQGPGRRALCQGVANVSG